jgi:NADPH-dependent curcumin reductase CurA
MITARPWKRKQIGKCTRLKTLAFFRISDSINSACRFLGWQATNRYKMEKTIADLVNEIGNLAQVIKDNTGTSRTIYTVPMASEMTKVEAIASQILTGLVSKYNTTNPEDQELMCQLSIELAETLLNTLNARLQ